jgi:hypothetical protein
MTTEAAARLYEAQHLAKWADKKYVVFNPHNKPVEELPVIYGFNNGGERDWLQAVLLAEDGQFMGDHICSSEAYMPHDLGIIEDSRPDRHKEFQAKYPDGYRMDFVKHNHPGVIKAVEKNNQPPHNME